MDKPDTPADSPASDVVILGGGIAGGAAALEFLEAGWQVTLVEARGFLGGRAFSFTDQETGMSLDNGQHVFVGCCDQFLGFLERVGARHRWRLQDRLDIPVRSRTGRVGRLAASPLPSPLHLLPSFLAYPHLTFPDKLRALWGMFRAKLANRHASRMEEITFYQWLRESGQSERAIDNLWNLVIEPTLNDNVRQVSAAMGLMIVQEGMLAGATAANLGYAVDGLLPSLGEPLQERLEELGATLVLGDPVKCIEVGSSPDMNELAAGVIAVELASGRSFGGSVFVSCLPARALLRVLPPALQGQEWVDRIAQLEWAPIVNLHVLFDRPVMDGAFCAFVDSPLQWVFNRDHITGEPAPEGGQLLAVSVSAAWDYVDREREEIFEELVAEMSVAFPAAREAQVLHATVVKQREATFRCLPGADRLRPGATTPLANLYLAGEWTNTGWPSTMEGAVRSGYRAAAAAMGREGHARFA